MVFAFRDVGLSCLDIHLDGNNVIGCYGLFYDFEKSQNSF
ncbi:hypothetical protein XBI1_1570017 [Xenorhabdus bovienii str. Intermedium]|uniref:Uncharacterized protein n=1 Tax=Xenorhabdus bovienii str. Intermedium TaxID=1379677 RepID=A0A077QEH4_XENBV|nr:hypothetical protein XBI1_1570017 [Xenorhabdus bovienii str. Intermedium]